jgi:hypothetical protein
MISRLADFDIIPHYFYYLIPPSAFRYIFIIAAWLTAALSVNFLQNLKVFYIEGSICSL